MVVEFSLFFRVPLGQARRKIEDDAQLRHLRGLELGQAGQLDPAVGAAGGDADVGHLHQNQQHEGGGQHEDGHPSEILVVELGGQVHDDHPRRGKNGLPLDVPGGVVVGHRLVVIGRGVGGGEHHDEADAGKQQHQHQEGQVQRPPGQLLFHRQVALGFGRHGATCLSSAESKSDYRDT